MPQDLNAIYVVSFQPADQGATFVELPLSSA